MLEFIAMDSRMELAGTAVPLCSFGIHAVDESMTHDEFRHERALSTSSVHYMLYCIGRWLNP